MINMSDVEDLHLSTPRYFKDLQSTISQELEQLDGKARFTHDCWEKSPDDSQGGGVTMVLTDGAVFEKAGVNFSAVSGTMPAEMVLKLGAGDAEADFFATGTSLVLHPRSPMVPTVHANVRFVKVGKMSWFGGGADLTPYYLFDQDAIHFHRTFKNSLDPIDQDLYPKYKKWCDEYFYIPHRDECRGIGGVFCDYLGRADSDQLSQGFEIARAIGGAFLEAYCPIVKRTKDLSFGSDLLALQLMRRGRYAEFNLMYDRGTLFGLKTGGRIESILMSLPPVASWDYDWRPLPNSNAAYLYEVLKHPKEWL